MQKFIFRSRKRDLKRLNIKILSDYELLDSVMYISRKASYIKICFYLNGEKLGPKIHDYIYSSIPTLTTISQINFYSLLYHQDVNCNGYAFARNSLKRPCLTLRNGKTEFGIIRSPILRGYNITNFLYSKDKRIMRTRLTNIYKGKVIDV